MTGFVWHVLTAEAAQQLAGGTDATANGVTFTYTYSLTAGAASGEVNATATGATLTYTFSLIDGAATGEQNATASGQTLAYTYSLIDGAASGEVNAAATGQTLTYTYSLIDGFASSGTSATANGETLTITYSLIDGAASATEDAAGVIGGSWRPIQYVGGKKKPVETEEQPLEVTEDELNQWLESLRAPILRQEQIAAAIEALKAKVMGEVVQAELQGLVEQAMYAMELDEAESDELLLMA